MAEEIERKFLVVGDFKKFAHNSKHLVQGYIASGRRTVRVRISDKEAWLTIKGPSKDGGLSRFEWEKPIEAVEAFELLSLAEGALIDKQRYYVEYEGHTFEVDEFASVDEEFECPEWLGREVTGEKRFYNSHLRAHPYNEWTEEEKH